MSSEMDEIWILFADDGGQSLDAMEAALENLQEGSEDEAPAHISALFRAVHTFKGNSRVLGLATVESRAHIAEDLIGLVRDDGVPLDEGILDVLFYAADTFRGMLDEVAASRQDVDPGPSEPLMQQLRETIARCTGKEVEAPAAEAPAADTQESAPEPQSDDAPAQDDAPSAPAAAPAGGGLDLSAQFGDIFDSLGGSFGDDDMFDDDDDDAFGSDDDDDDDEDDVAEAPAPTPAPAPAPAHPVSSVVIDETPLESKLDDEQYREIFKEMVDDTIAKVQYFKDDTESDPNSLLKKTRGKASSLSYACEQLELDDWVSELNGFVEMAKEIEEISLADYQSAAQDLITLIEDLSAGVFGGGGPKVEFETTEEVLSLFEALETSFNTLDEVGRTFVKGTPDTSALNGFEQKVETVLGEYGYVNVVQTAKLVENTSDPDGFADLQLAFYEELLLVDDLLQDVDSQGAKRPTELLHAWASKNALRVFTAASTAVDALQKGQELDLNFRRFERYMRITTHACNRYKIFSASQLAMTLVDLFLRIKDGGHRLDKLLSHIAHSFIDTLDSIFDSIAQGDEPNIQEIEELFEKATSFSFNSKTKVTAREIERRLGLPESFHRVLSPDSIEKAMVSIGKEHRFYIIRADLNEDEKMAQAFLELVGAGTLDMITNVTVFKDDITLFDFLVGSDLDESGLIEALANIDPSAKNLHMIQVLKLTSLKDTSDAPDAAAPATEERVETMSPSSMQSSLSMLETIGEISAGHAMIHHRMTALAETDLMQHIEQALREAGQPRLTPVARSAVRSAVDKFLTEMQEVSEAEAQLTAQLAELQEESVSLRSRPAEALLNPLKAYVETTARKFKKEARLTVDGQGVSLDQVIIEDLRDMLKSILTMRLGQEQLIDRFHVSVSREEDHVNVIIEDNGPIDMDQEVMREIEEMISQQNGTIRVVELLNGGVRFYISLALHMIVLDGMVVRVQDVHYVVPIDSILRIHQGDQNAVKTISAANGGKVLRLDQGEHVPIHTLRGSANGAEVAPAKDHDSHVYVIVRNAERQLAIPVDELLGQQLVLLRPLRGVLSSMRDLTGIALLAGGEVGMVLAVSRLAAA